jgi:hypothetical protein
MVIKGKLKLSEVIGMCKLLNTMGYDTIFEGQGDGNVKIKIQQKEVIQDGRNKEN